MLKKRQPKKSYRQLLPILLCLSGCLLASCSLVPISEGEALKQTELRGTELEVHVKQTLLAQQQTDRDAERTRQAIIVTAPTQEPQPVPPATQLPTAKNETPISQPQESTTTTAPIESTEQKVIDEAEFQAWMPTAKILLYEDMTARLDTIRYVKQTLDEMGLKYKDDGSALGWLIKDFADGPENEGPWDLIILAAEDKAGVKANFFGDVLKAIDQGTSVILEVWYLDGTHSTSASGLLSRCGIEYENNWIRIPPSRAAMFALSPENSILQQPNNGLGFSSTTEFWWDPTGNQSYDTGDQVKLSADSQATLLLGTTANTPTTHGTSTVCMDGQLILQSFSSHTLTYKTMAPLWENYIYNSLRTRFSLLN